MKRFGLIFGVMCTVLSGGCSLKAPLNLDGAQCSDETHALEAVIFNQEVCYPEDVTGERSQTCERFADAFEYGYCPGEAKFCINTSDKPDEIRNVCSPIKCDITKEHEYNGQCEKNSLDNCGQHGYRCEDNIPGWQNGECRNGVLGKGKGVIGAHCHAKECSIGYDWDDDNGVCNPTLKCGTDEYYYYNEAIDKPSCKPNSVENCGKQGYRCDKTAGWSDGKCEAGQCVPNACANGYKLEAGQCVVTMNCKLNQHIEDGQCVDDDEKHCGSLYNDCTMNLAWKSGLCLNGSCVATACSSGYAVDEKNKRCSPIPCDGYWLNDVCQPYDVDNCGRAGRKCSTLNPKWADGECVEGECVVKSCIAGYELKNGQCESTCDEGEHKAADGETCEPDSVTACGAFNNDCTEDKVSISPVCQNGRCYANDCIPNYRAVDGICEQIKACPVGYHVKDETCVPDTDAACGDAMINCNQYQNATSGLCSIGGACIATACKAGYHLYNGACEENSDNHCGAHGASCDTLHLYTCNVASGQCGCPAGYDEINHLCVKKSVDVVCDSNHYAEVFFDGEMVKAYCLSSASDLEAMREGLATNATWPTSNSQRAFVLVNDIDLGTQQTWEPLPFPVQGILVGNAHNIVGELTCDGDCALFDTFEEAKVNDLNLNFKITAEGNAASLAMNVNYTKIKNVHVKAYDPLTSNHGEAAGFIYNMNSSSITDSSFSGDVIAGDVNSASGFVFESYESVYKNCRFEGLVTSEDVSGLIMKSWHDEIISSWSFGQLIGLYVGGLIRTAEGCVIMDSGSKANIISSSNIGLAAGLVLSIPDDGGDIIRSIFEGSITGQFSEVGGLVGSNTEDSLIIRDSVFNGFIKSSAQSIGGLLACASLSEGSFGIHNCGVFGVLDGMGKNGKIGGLFAETGGVEEYGGGVYIDNFIMAADIMNTDKGMQIGDYVKITQGYSTGAFSNVAKTSTDIMIETTDYYDVPDSDFYYWYADATDSQFSNIRIDYVGMDQKVGDGLLVDALNKAYQEANSSTESPWELRVCEITTGPAKGTPTKYNMAVPKSMVDISICKPYTPQVFSSHSGGSDR